VKLRTHNVGGITEKDFALAKQIEQVTLWRPGQEAPLDGTPNKWVRGGSKE
jgi:4a-hydroxytetrahydrobiopterin dehydratase